MTDIAAIREITATYERHGWILRRVLLSDKTRKQISGPLEARLSEVPLIPSKTDAAWFSRAPKSGPVAWEIRYLGDIPFALLEHVDEEDPAFESILNGVEERLFSTIAAKISA